MSSCPPYLEVEEVALRYVTLVHHVHVHHVHVHRVNVHHVHEHHVPHRPRRVESSEENSSLTPILRRLCAFFRLGSFALLALG